MDRLQLISKLNEILLEERPQCRESAAQFGQDEGAQRRLLRSLMNTRPPVPFARGYLVLQDELLSIEREEKGVADVALLPATDDPRMLLWRGDITRLNADAVVNAANSALLGCFYPCHGCIDNAIHSAAGLQLRDECSRIMLRQGHAEAVGRAKLTAAYNLPCKYVLHTVGPAISGKLRERDCAQLASCYHACLDLAEKHGISSIAFCCISTGEFRFPAEIAAGIAVNTVREYLRTAQKEIKVIFNVFKESDETIYRKLLGPDRQAETGA